MQRLSIVAIAKGAAGIGVAPWSDEKVLAKVSQMVLPGDQPNRKVKLPGKPK
jgi:hypothetical protein